MLTKFLDYDARRSPRTSRFCCMCQRDLELGSEVREVRLQDTEPFVIHPTDPAWQSGSRNLVGADCANRLGLEWSVSVSTDETTGLNTPLAVLNLT